MAVLVQEIIGPEVNGQSAAGVKKKNYRNDEHDVESLIALHHRVEAVARGAGAVFHPQFDDAQIIKEQRPDDDGVKRSEDKPHEWIAQSRERQRFHQRAGDVEKIVYELDRPSDQCQRVDERPGPEEQNDEETRSD